MTAWIKASACSFGDCVLVDLDDGHTGVLVAHSISPGRQLRFTTAEWRAFVDGVKAGEFDLPEETA